MSLTPDADIIPTDAETRDAIRVALGTLNPHLRRYVTWDLWRDVVEPLLTLARRIEARAIANGKAVHDARQTAAVEVTAQMHASGELPPHVKMTYDTTPLFTLDLGTMPPPHLGFVPGATATFDAPYRQPVADPEPGGLRAALIEGQGTFPRDPASSSSAGHGDQLANLRDPYQPPLAPRCNALVSVGSVTHPPQYCTAMLRPDGTCPVNHNTGRIEYRDPPEESRR